MKLSTYFLGAGEALDQETWLKILQRQEAVHQLELQKWHDLLGNAATLLKQVCNLILILSIFLEKVALF